MKAEGIQGWFDYPEFYRKAVEMAPEKAIMVEIGSWLGKSVLEMVELGESKQLNVYAVDMWSGVGNYRDKQKTDPAFLGQFIDNVNRLGMSGRVTPIVSDTVQAARGFGDGTVFMAFIDGSHDYDSVMADIKAWTPKIVKGGIIAGHDYAYSPDVRRAVAEVFGNVETCESCWWKRI